MTKHKKRKGFTLIELLMVVAIISILASIILIGLNSAREKASLNKYVAYAAQMHRLVADSVAAGYFDHKTSHTPVSGSFCLGMYGSKGNATCSSTGSVQLLDESIGTAGPQTVYAALTQLGALPDKVEYSPYAPNEGVHMVITPRQTIRINMYLLSTDTAFLTKVCNSMNWGTDTNNGYCYADVSLNSRL